MTELVSVRQFAKLDGCSHTLVARAIKDGKLPISAGGLLDPALAGTGWRKQNRSGNTSGNKGGNTATVATPVSTPETKPKRRRGRAGAAAPEPVIAFSDELQDGDVVVDPEQAIDFIAEVLAGRFLLTGHAERVKENANAAKSLLAARREAGDVVDLETAEAVLFEQARQFRDAWMNWPARVGPLIAAELGIVPEPVVEALNKHVQQQLQDLGEPEAEFADAGEG